MLIDTTCARVKGKKFDISGEEVTKWFLRNQNLQHARICRANLRCIDAPGFDLTGVIFDRVDLTNANLSRAKISLGSFIDCNLTGANLKGTDLEGVYVKESIFSEVSFNEHTNINSLLLCGIDCRDARGIEKMKGFAKYIPFLDEVKYQRRMTEMVNATVCNIISDSEQC